MSTLGELLHSAVDGVFAVDDKQRIIYWDAGCEDLFGWSSHWVLGRPCYSVTVGQNPVTGACHCQQGCPVPDLGGSAEGPNHFPIRTINKQGEEINLTVNIALVPSHCKKGWISMHLLHREGNTDVLGALDMAQPMAGTLCEEETVQRLSKREHEVLQLLAEGLSVETISKRLNISRTTVRNHLQHVQHKLGVHSQTEAVSYAYRHGMMQ